MRILAVCIALLSSISLHGACGATPVTEFVCPSYSGGLYAGGGWIYLEPVPSDGDLEYGSFIKLTRNEPNLNALLLQVEPCYQNAFDIFVGYQIPCSNQNLKLDYFYFNATGSDGKEINARDELIQNFLGASYSVADAFSREKIHQVDLTYGLDFIVDYCDELSPFFGVGFADIRRKLQVDFEDLVLNANPSDLTGTEKSKYWGVGPVFGTDFSLPLFQYLRITGHFELGFLFGKTKSELDSESFRNNVTASFFAKDRDNRAVTVLNSELGFVFAQPMFNDCFQLELEVGYRVDYYFKPINRINPFDGYVNNPNTFPVNQSSNLGYHGPYITLTFAPGRPCMSNPFLCNPLCNRCADTGLYFHFINTWLKPHPTKGDLTYATVETNGKTRGAKIHPDTTWTGTYELGFQFCGSYDLEARYFHLETRDADKTSTGEISSLNASGPFFVTFSSARSKARYEVDQIDVVVGKSMQLLCPLNVRGYFGLRYLDLKRSIDNVYSGGEPPLTTQEKFPKLRSRFDGIGPMFGIDPSFTFFNHFAIVGRFDTALAIGDMKATLDQNNLGLLGPSSNDVRTPKTAMIVPVVNAKGGLGYNCNFSCIGIHLEGGYQYTAYYRGINLLFPNLLTGLGQNNNNLKLTGPYLDVGLDICF